jgi:hypothetical protein
MVAAARGVRRGLRASPQAAEKRRTSAVNAAQLGMMQGGCGVC